MKKLLSIILLISACLPGISQLIGNGTYANPWRGTLNGNATWSGTIYINGDITVDNETLSISPGAHIIFVAEGADLIITSTGRLLANGAQQNMILFTADDDNDGIYGESGENWGHIYVNSSNSAQISLIDYCIIEYGLNTGTGMSGYGGGINIYSNQLTLSNCEIRNNVASIGGGIAVYWNVSPIISNCKITANQSNNTGGGLFIASGSAAILSNCIINNNFSLGGGGGGGLFLGNLCGNVKIINCTIVGNQSTGAGKNIRLYYNTNPTRPTFINCIIWSPDNSIIYSGQTPNSTDFVNCAILNPTTGSTTNCISLSALNTDPTGPNFVATDGTDWSIEFVSPCRDAGIIPTPPVPLDYLGFSRIGQYDIGAYEFQYARWTGATDVNWSLASNWYLNTLPSSSSYVDLPSTANNPTTSSDVTIGELILHPGAILTIGGNSTFIGTNIDNSGTININPTSQVTFSEIINNGVLNLNSSSISEIFSMLVDNYSGTGVTNAQLFINGGGGPFYNWHYVAQPFLSGLSTSYFTDVNPFNLLLYNDSRVVTSDYNGWEYYNGYAGTYGIAGGAGFTTMTFGRGYNFYNGTDAVVTLSGSTPIGTTLGNISLQYSGPTPGSLSYGYNLLGNSLTCSLDWDLVTFSGSVNSAVYYTTGNRWATYLPLVGGTNGATKDIPPLQGFFVKANDTGASVDLSAARGHSTQPRYKKSGSEELPSKEEKIFPKIKLELSGTGTSDETILWYNNEATDGFDEKYDAIKMFSSESIFSQIYTILEEKNYVINGIPLPTDSIIVPLGIKISQTGSYSLIKKDFIAPYGYRVFLIDKTNNLSVNLRENEKYDFTSDAGTFSDRFLLKFISITTGIDDPVAQKKDFNIYSFYDIVNIIPMNTMVNSSKGEIKIFDLTGRIVKQINNVEWYEGTPVQVPCNELNGIYMVEVHSGTLRFIGKVIMH